MKITPPTASITRRALLALAPLLAASPGPRDALAADFTPRVDVLSTPDICQGRCREQDFVCIKYVGRLTDTGKVFDERYAQKPLIYELGSFYLPGLDKGLKDVCVGTKLRFTWARSPALGPEFEAVLPAGSPIELQVELVNIKYALFGEKMRDATNPYWFARAPLTLTSAADYEHGHSSSREPTIGKDNPFSIAAGEKNLISNPQSVLSPIFGELKLPELGRFESSPSSSQGVGGGGGGPGFSVPKLPEPKLPF